VAGGKIEIGGVAMKGEKKGFGVLSVFSIILQFFKEKY